MAEDLRIEQRPLSALESPGPGGWLATNPPYGVRVGEAEGLRDLYAALGRTLRGAGAGWTLALLSADRRLEGHIGIALREVLRTQNGGIPVRLSVGRAGVAE